MPEKSLVQVKEELRRIHQYKWEFLRRNKKYQTAFDKYTVDKKEALFRYETEEEFNNWDGDRATEFFEEWGINYPCDYRQRTPEFLFEIAHDANPVVPQVRVPVKNPNGEIVKGYNHTWGDILIRDGDEEIRIPHTVVFCFNLDYPKTKIMPLFEERLDELIKKRRELFKKYKLNPDRRLAQLGESPNKSRKKRTLYDEYLRAWDFVEENKAKMNWKLMANKLYPKGTVSEHRLRERYKACKELIDGGYVDIK